MTGIHLQAMLAHPRWASVVDLSRLETDPPMTGSTILRDLNQEVAPKRPGELLVVLYSADRHDWRLDTLLSRAASHAVAALLLESVQPLQSSTHALAARLGLPILGTPTPLLTLEAFVRLRAQCDIELADLVLRTLAGTARSGPDLDDLLRQVTRALRRPVALVDGHGTVMAGQVDLLQDTLAASLPAHGPARVRLRLDPGSVLLAHPVGAAGTQAWLVAHVPGEIPAELDALQAALTVTAPAIEQRLAVLRMSLERDARRRTSLLAEVVQGPVTAAIRRRALDLGWELDGWHTALHLGAEHGVDYSDRRSEVMTAAEAEHLVPVVVESSDGWAAWITARREPGPEEVRATAIAIRRVHHRLHTVLPVHTGVGRPYPGPEGLGRSLSEAADAARLARSRPESGHFVHIDRLGVAQMLLAWTRTDTFQPAARSLLAPLTNHPGDLIATLSTYLDAESSVAETAAVLGVHRNTVAARMRRVESLLRVDLSVPDDRLALHLACRTSLRAPG